MKNVLVIARNEFLLLARNPIVLVFGIVILAYAIINTAGSSTDLQRFSSNHADSLLVGVFGLLWILSLLFAFLSMCIGVISIADEKSKGSLRVLLAKPVYRRDVIIGKFIGISTFLFLLIILTVTLFVSLMIAVYSGPESSVEFVLRMASFAILLF
jgi:ABC-2 type transport system permease protein